MITNLENIDYLAEVIVSHLLTNKKVSDSNLFVHYLGIFKRFFSRDIEKIDQNTNGEGIKEWNVFVHREGLYDILPEGLFHKSTTKYFKDLKETIDEFRIHKEEEKSSRQFFMPLEQEYFKHYVHKEIFEQNFYHSLETIQEFIDFFNLNHLELNIYQKASLFFIMPHIPKISGNIGLTETCFRIILQEHVKVEVIYKPKETFFDAEPASLESEILGYNSILGNSYVDYGPKILLEIGPLEDSTMLLSYLFGSKRKVVAKLVELFIQVK